MTNLSLNLNREWYFRPIVKCNGKMLKLKKNSYSKFSTAINSDDASLKFQVFNYYELSEKYWFLYVLFFWVLGLFGWFSPRFDKKCPAFNCEFEIENAENLNLTIDFNRFADGKPAFVLKGVENNVSENSTNVYFVNKVAQKRVRIIKWLKFLGFILTVAGVIFLISYLSN